MTERPGLLSGDACLLNESPAMSPVAILLLSASMSVDAFAVAVGRGATIARPRLAEAFRTALVFGIVETITPFAGWLAGLVANDWVASYDHWIAFGLLAGVGLHMIHGALRADGSDAPRQNAGASLLVLLATAFGTSLDALAVGLSLALIDLDLAGILAVSAGVGITTFCFALAGMYLGGIIGQRFGRIAEVAAGLVLCAIGGTILFEHLAG